MKLFSELTETEKAKAIKLLKEGRPNFTQEQAVRDMLEDSTVHWFDYKGQMFVYHEADISYYKATWGA